DRQRENSADSRAREYARELGSRDSVSSHGSSHAEVWYRGAPRSGHPGAHHGEVVGDCITVRKKGVLSRERLFCIYEILNATKATRGSPMIRRAPRSFLLRAA